MRRLFLLLALPLTLNAEELSPQALQAEIVRLRADVKRLSEQLEGQAAPINLGRTSLAAVEASGVNGSRSLDNCYYGVQNAFDNGSNWINGINYTYWLGGGSEDFIQVHFDVPVAVHSIVVEGGPEFTTLLTLDKGGEIVLPRATATAAPSSPVPGVAKVRLNFTAGGASNRVHEIRIMGFPPPGAKYEPGTPRILMTSRNAQAIAEAAWQEWRDSLAYGIAPVVEESKTDYVILYRRTSVIADGQMLREPIYRVTISKATGHVSRQPLALLATTRPTDR